MRVSFLDDIWNRYSILTNDKNAEKANKIRLKKIKPDFKTNINFNNHLINERKNNEFLCKHNSDDSFSIKEIEQKNLCL